MKKAEKSVGQPSTAPNKIPFGTDLGIPIPLTSAYQVDQAILCETERLVIIRFGDPTHLDCILCDELLLKVAPILRRWAVIYFVDCAKPVEQGGVPDFNGMYELYDPQCIMFFYRTRHIQVDCGTGNNNKINWVLQDKQELIDLAETVWKGARKGKGLVMSPRDYSSRYRY